ncbi:hypothetical protein ASPWEDRAFT_588401 [Aspergillus wentii DTO 134E9]|uniref:Uncharacterized protein n=1 Tax=Aspergillus wentii DTO 134E9 TaxID=1073089 RepID=A0A1L9RCM4_ASPWE|nr:uncharacterized protein ASPWEDRAFT_588401 [Aspergillus wentii DTO 134E9]OJJ32638.1 hypothetical protein ASPWEDRAFT_588401 [Aspergillus wentii DTO 134E9]
MRPMTLTHTVAEGRFPQLDDTSAVDLFRAKFEPELVHLQKASATVESGAPDPPGSLNGSTPSRYLYKHDYVEVNRTLVNMLALKWVLAGDYNAFTACQKEQGKLSEQSFREMKEYFNRRLPTNEDIYYLLAAIVVDDIGKDPGLAKELGQRKQKALRANIRQGNHSEVLHDVAKAGKIQALNDLPEPGHTIVLRNIDIGERLNVSQLVQGENVPACLSILRQTKEDAQAFDMRAMVTVLDVAGAAAHRDARGCLVMNETVYKGYMTTIETMKRFVDGDIPSERECYDQLLSDRLNTVGMKEDELSTDRAERRALLRMFCMGRVDTKSRADFFISAFRALQPTTRTDLVNGLNVDGLDDGVAVIPYYAPGLFAEVLRAYTDREDSDVVKALSAFMRLLARVFDGSKPEQGRKGDIIERDLAFIQDDIKSEAFRRNPNILDDVPLKWDKH